MRAQKEKPLAGGQPQPLGKSSLSKWVTLDTLPACLALAVPSRAAGPKTVHTGLQEGLPACPFLGWMFHLRREH